MTGCVLQSEKSWDSFYPQYDEFNVVTGFQELLRVFDDNGHGLLHYYQQSDAIALGVGPVGPVGTGVTNAVSFQFRTPVGVTNYMNHHLVDYGETGEVSHTVVSDNSFGTHYSGQIIPSESIYFSENSIALDYQFEWVLR